MGIDKLLPDFNHLTPEAASLGKYGTIAMSEYTGTPNIRIPLLEVKSGDVSYPIELYYDASGIKVEQNATFVGLGWTSNSHTGLPVPVFALGAGQEEFKGFYDNTEIYKKLAKLTKVVKD